MRKLRSNVHVHDEHGRSHVFGPDDQVPAWVAERITNPRAWQDNDPEDEPPAGTTDGASPPSGEPKTAAGPPPPKSGPGSGTDRWAEYATAHNVRVPAGASREQIWDLLTAASIPIE